MREGLVSIITPAYNASKYIKETIESVLNQTYDNWELIIINDGSTDDTEKIVNSFKDRRIKLISQKNMGVSAARNRGLSEAKGEFITFLDADDILPPKSLEVRVKYLKENSNIDLVDGKILIKDENMKKIKRIYQPYYMGPLLPKLLELDDRVFFNVCYFFRSNKLNGLKFKKTSHAEDLLFFIELSYNQNINYSYVNEEVYYYRSGHNSAMSNLDGLEIGYITLLQEIKKMQKVKKINIFKLKLKITKIMVLSWLNSRDIFKAIKSLKVLFV